MLALRWGKKKKGVMMGSVGNAWKKSKKVKTKYICKGSKKVCSLAITDEDCVRCDLCEEWYHPKARFAPSGEERSGAEGSGAEGSGAEREKINPTKSVRRSGNSVNFKLAATGERSVKRCIILSIATHFIKLKRITNKQLVAAVTAS